MSGKVKLEGKDKTKVCKVVQLYLTQVYISSSHPPSSSPQQSSCLVQLTKLWSVKSAHLYSRHPYLWPSTVQSLWSVQATLVMLLVLNVVTMQVSRDNKRKKERKHLVILDFLTDEHTPKHVVSHKA